MEIKKNLVAQKKEKPSFDALGFGKYFTDHMFKMTYTQGQGWHDAEICAYAPISLSPSALIFHYGQETFEGLKAYRDENDKITLFRARDNFERMNRSNDRICIPPIDVDFVMEALKELLLVEKDWIPNLPGTSLYIRPFVIATEAALGVKVSSEYLFMIILSPVGSYYAKGLAPTSIYVEEHYVRASQGGTGEAKCSGNYAASLKPYVTAKEKGYEQVLFLDAKEQKYIEEVGTSNAFFVIDGVAVTSPLHGTILPGITRDSILKLLADKNIPHEERAITIDEVFEAYKNGKLQESFATGTAAVISPIGKLTYKDETALINEGKIGKLSQMLYDELTGIQTGKLEDRFGWVIHVN